MKKIAIIGNGNVGTHLFKVFTKKKKDVSLINSHSLEGLHPDFDYLIISVKDNAIEEVAKRISSMMSGFVGTVAHTSGSTGISVLAPYFKEYGVFYPLQTFSKDIPINDYSIIPVFIEGNNRQSTYNLRNLAKDVFAKIYELTSEKREMLHVASVFACNFSNVMYSIASDILKENEIPFEVLIPLLTQTTNKLNYSSPDECQTGPAIRGDVNIIKNHLALLAGKEDLQKIYKELSEFILKRYK